jgi:hypothetical protein
MVMARSVLAAHHSLADGGRAEHRSRRECIGRVLRDHLFPSTAPQIVPPDILLLSWVRGKHMIGKNAKVSFEQCMRSKHLTDNMLVCQRWL